MKLSSMSPTNWKFSLSDIHERKYWKQYAKAYEDSPARDKYPSHALVRRSYR